MIRSLFFALTLVGLTVAFLAPSFAADSTEGFVTVVRGGRSEDGLTAQRRVNELSPGFASAIEVDYESGARPADALPEIIARTPGASVRSIGGLGQFSAISLRGSSGEQVSVFLDGVPLGSSLGGLVDLSAIPIDTIGVVEIYRGYIPVVFGGATIGGAINLVGKVHHGPAMIHASAGYGSFVARQAQIASAIPVSDYESVAVRLGYGGANGAFTFYDNNGTPQFLDDDSESVRTNNGFNRLIGQVRLDGHRQAWRYGLQQLVLWRHNGVPGRASAQAEATDFNSLGFQTTGFVSKQGTFVSGDKLELRLGVGLQRRQFQDPNDEVGIAINNQVTKSADLFLSPRFYLPLWSSAMLGLSLDGRGEWIDVQDLLDIDPLTGVPTGDAQRRRFSEGFGLQLEQRFWDDRIKLVPAFRIDVIHSLFATPAGSGEQDDNGRDRTLVGISPRIGGNVQLISGLQLRTSVGRYFRPPTLVELFGDQGFAVGNEGLAPERGTSVDGGFLLDWNSGDEFTVHGQLAGFANWSQESIQWISSGSAARPTNLPGARILGLELGTSIYAWRGRIRLQSSYTFAKSRNESPEIEQNGKPLPGRPEHTFWGRLSFGDHFRLAGVLCHPRLFYVSEHISGNFLDPSGRRRIPARTLHGLGLELSAGAFRIAVEGRNILDLRTTTWTPPVRRAQEVPVPVSDFIGYPLPGRSLFITVSFDHAFATI